ncbi:hypothetical protein UFOVP116_33 [uncultured Caudovirales phage]|uniref:Uncharacterized protein n=1 Tax=uncultured Caudovirales phage TaxID=2100421 RepID=A0A6J5L7S1_9CAUD|nr:hypothetical protein UFOVP116_33 [uncultured Caudovirales phage]
MSITKSFGEYLMESKTLYHFKLRIAAEVSKDQLAKISRELEQYDAEKITDPKRLPVQRNSTDFPQLGATEITHIDLTLHYPVTTPELTAAILRAVGLPESHVLVRTDVQAADALPVPQQDDAQNKTADELTAKNIGTEAQVANLLKELESMAFKYASPNKEKLSTTNELPQGTKSAIGSTVPKTPKIELKK